jgi:site-specific recombinase XerD
LGSKEEIMFESWITRPHDRRRLETSTLCRELVLFAESLESHGYPPRTLRRYLFAAAALGRWIQRHGWSIDRVDESRLQQFVVGRRRYRCRGRNRGRLPDLVHGIRRFVEVLRAGGIMPRTPVRPEGPIDEIVAAFDSHLDRVGGLVVATRKTYGRYARALLETRFGTTVPDLQTLDAECVSEFVRAQTGRLNVSARRLPATATRTFLRFLITRGLVADGLAGAVPSVRQWKHASLPSYLSAQELAAVYAACPGATPTGRRDHAVVMMLSQLGLRACELAHLRLDDIRWHDAVVSVRGAKSGRERVLPLPQDVGVAIAGYLREGRPPSNLREVFLAVRAPFGALTASAVGSIVAGALQRAGVQTVHRGAHVFRHTAATRMVRAGATFKEVADVLGHARIETTTIYAKLDVDTLARVALPWPESAS